MRTVAHLIQFVKTSLYASCLPQTMLVGACDKEGRKGDRRTGIEKTISALFSEQSDWLGPPPKPWPTWNCSPNPNGGPVSAHHSAAYSCKSEQKSRRFLRKIGHLPEADWTGTRGQCPSGSRLPKLPLQPSTLSHIPRDPAHLCSGVCWIIGNGCQSHWKTGPLSASPGALPGFVPPT